MENSVNVNFTGLCVYMIFEALLVLWSCCIWSYSVKFVKKWSPNRIRTHQSQAPVSFSPRIRAEMKLAGSAYLEQRNGLTLAAACGLMGYHFRQ